MNRFRWATHRLALVLAAMALFMVGCRGGDDSQSLVVTSKTGAQVKLNGKWIAGCRNDDNTWNQEKLRISGSEMKITKDVWLAGSSCSGNSEVLIEGASVITLIGTDTAKFGGADATATNVDVTTVTLTATAKDDTTAFYLGELAWYGYSIWLKGKAQNILNIAADGTIIDNSSRKDLLLVDDGVAPNRLYFGDPSTAPVDGYPTEVDVISSYEKK